MLLNFYQQWLKGMESIMICGQLCGDTNILWLVDPKNQYIHSFEKSNVEGKKIYVE
jgi:hypothetical protein